MLNNFWENISFCCMNHRKPIPMIIKEGDTPFYACPKYFLEDDDHPDGHSEYESMCTNTLSFSSADMVVETFMAEVEDDMSSGALLVDYNNDCFKVGTIECCILKYGTGRCIIGVKDKRKVYSP